MTEAKASYHRILRSTSIIGGASFINIAIGVLRTKVLAVLLGPAGVGLASLYTGLMGPHPRLPPWAWARWVRARIAQAYSKEDPHAIMVARRALFWGTMVLAGAGGLVVWSLRSILARVYAAVTRHTLARSGGFDRCGALGCRSIAGSVDPRHAPALAISPVSVFLDP